MLQPGSRVGHYEILGSLGAGGMGEVYRARDPRLDRPVAIKVLSPQVAGNPDALAHPNILSIFEFGRDGETSFVVTELVDGETLRRRLEAGPLPPRRAVAYALQIARGIAAAHARGIVHRDLKPANVMITGDEQVKILDFGLAKPVDLGPSDATRGPSPSTAAGGVLGTFGYMAPEQVRGLQVDHRTDIFAFGAVLYEMLSGVRAFKGDAAADTMSAILSQDPPEFDAARLAIPPAVERIVRRCLEKNPELRFQSANDLAFALDTLSQTTSSGAASIVDAFATEEIGDPASRLAVSAIYVVPAAGGTPRRILDGDGVQPSFSPSGGPGTARSSPGMSRARAAGRRRSPSTIWPRRRRGSWRATKRGARNGWSTTAG